MIEVRRSTVWEDVCAKLGQKSFSPNNRFLVKFVNKEGESEEAVDLNGPKRELLRLAVKAANENSNIFFGPPGCRSLFANTTARKRGLYRFVGMLLAWSLAHGGPGGKFLSPTLYDSLAYGPCEKPPRLEDVADPDLKEKIIKIYNSKSQEEFENNLEDEEIKWILYAQGLAILRVFEKKDEIVGIILRHVLVDSTRSHFEEFKKGLETLGVLKAIQANPEQFRKEFTHQNVDAFDAKRMQALFEINYFERGSNERHDGDAKATLGEVLSFVTGADVPPPLGFGCSSFITFTDRTLPTADTCTPVLHLPTVHRSYDKFKEIMDFSILNSPYFGHP
ncbi:G2/M phase-specific E3 ubiquitin-protein ligase [Acropora cervicornis]|uniref:HECT-type E3 ubiquitin transferase n=1 Tax=Acropora cervicornis TaxID=6130 RepID=A0AAD9V260_ACRCE|nr:G2/M phase-specific E3 ubiquitin-protein ligase [Acropora cervicornis]